MTMRPWKQFWSQSLGVLIKSRECHGRLMAGCIWNFPPVFWGKIFIVHLCYKMCSTCDYFKCISPGFWGWKSPIHVCYNPVVCCLYLFHKNLIALQKILPFMLIGIKRFILFFCYFNLGATVATKFTCKYFFFHDIILEGWSVQDVSSF